MNEKETEQVWFAFWGFRSVLVTLMYGKKEWSSGRLFSLPPYVILSYRAFKFDLIFKKFFLLELL